MELTGMRRAGARAAVPVNRPEQGDDEAPPYSEHMRDRRGEPGAQPAHLTATGPEAETEDDRPPDYESVCGEGQSAAGSREHLTSTGGSGR
jgi:hypothetical protein